MHEKSVMDALIHQIEKVAFEQKAKKVVKVTVQLGALCHMSKEHFLEHFEWASRKTIAQDAEVLVEELSDMHDSNASYVILKRMDVSD